jgi:hypothetical protein
MLLVFTSQDVWLSRAPGTIILPPRSPVVSPIILPPNGSVVSAFEASQPASQAQPSPAQPGSQPASSASQPASQAQPSPARQAASQPSWPAQPSQPASQPTSDQQPLNQPTTHQQPTKNQPASNQATSQVQPTTKGACVCCVLNATGESRRWFPPLPALAQMQIQELAWCSLEILPCWQLQSLAHRSSKA